MSKIKLDVLKPWITKRCGELLKMEDDVVVEFIFNQLEEKVTNTSNIEYTYIFVLLFLPSPCPIPSLNYFRK